MPSLVIDAVRCVEETDESGSDDVYIIIFRGDPKPPFGSNVGVHGPGWNFNEGEFTPGLNWMDFDSGELWNPDVPIAMYFPDAVYMIMLVEEDNSRDISGAEILGAWRSQCGLVWRGALLPLQLSGQLPAPPAKLTTAAQTVGQTMLGLASLYMEFPKGNDDVIGKPQQVVISPGQTPTLHFKGDGGYYRIRFKIV